MKSAELKCQHCHKDFTVPFHRKDKAKYCGRACADAAPKKKNYARCRECGALFPKKKSAEKRSAIWGSFCSKSCISEFRKRNTVGEGNPNFRGRNFDHDGYRIYTPQASLGLGLGKIKLHHAVALLAVGLKEFPKGMHVHHRDCDVTNNEQSNLAFMTCSDHKWLHKQFGAAALKAVASGALDTQIAASWSDDPIRAEILLRADVSLQGVLMSHLRSQGVEPDIGLVAAIKPIRVTFDLVDDLSDTARGEGGFGSTGAK